MRYLKRLSTLILTAFIITALTAFAYYIYPGKQKFSGAMAGGKGFAVLELFTSEGCSSCPPADALMAKIQDEYKDGPVYLLAFHVDYWDRQGWKDAFSSSTYSKRQSEYGSWFNISSIYTPQVVVNGKSEFVGSDESKIRKAIAEALATDHTTRLSVQPRQDHDKLLLNYQVTDGSKNSRLLIAVVQRSAKTNVLRGENKGRLLSHVQIVRDLHSESLTKEGKGAATVALPQGFNGGEWEVIAMIQDLRNGGILAVTRVNL